MADDPLAPIQAGDDVRKILSASRQNALADAARIVRGSLPVRWGRNKKHPKPAASPIVCVGGEADKFSLFGQISDTEFTGTSPGDVELTYANLNDEIDWTVAFSSTAQLGFPSITDHPVFEWQDVAEYGVGSLKTKQSGIYRLTLEWAIMATSAGYQFSTVNTGATNGHTHTYSTFVSPVDRISVLIALGKVWTGSYSPGLIQFPIHGSGDYANDLAGVLVGYHAYTAGASIPVYLTWMSSLYESDDRINIRFLRLTAERVGDYVEA